MRSLAVVGAVILTVADAIAGGIAEPTVRSAIPGARTAAGLRGDLARLGVSRRELSRRQRRGNRAASRRVRGRRR